MVRVIGDEELQGEGGWESQGETWTPGLLWQRGKIGDYLQYIVCACPQTFRISMPTLGKSLKSM